MKRILLADDSPTMRVMMKKLLEKKGFDICGEAGNGREAIELYEILSPDIIIMDDAMPELDGYQATVAIKDRNPNVRIIMLLASKDEAKPSELPGSSADVFLGKPFDETKITAAVESLK